MLSANSTRASVLTLGTHSVPPLSLSPSPSCLLPNLSSPKLPQPIFFPTLKLGPTIRTELWLELTSREPREEVVPWEGRLPSLLLPFLVVPPRDAIEYLDHRMREREISKATHTNTKLVSQAQKLTEASQETAMSER